MDLNSLAMTISVQMQQIAELKEQLQKKDEDHKELIKRLDSIQIDRRRKGSPSQSNLNPKVPSKKPASMSKPKDSTSKNHPATRPSKTRTSTSTAKLETPAKNLHQQSGKAPKKTSATKPTATPSPKRNENQMIMKEVPEGFKMTKEALYCFVRLMWGMVQVGAVPPPPDVDNIKEFTSAFSSTEEIKNVVESTVARELVPQHEVLTLKSLAVGRRKMGRHIINIQEFFIKITQSSLAKLGIRVWGPNLLEPVDSLWNEACRLSALRIFRRVAIGGAFTYMNINKAYIEQFELLEGAYNHYVHYVMTEKFKKEIKEEGKTLKDEEKKVIQRARQRLRDARYKFAIQQGYKKRYLDLISPVDAHSDDEYSEKHRCYIVKTLPFRGANANAFFERLDQEMTKYDQIEGRRSQKRVRRRPKVPVMSTIGRPPHSMAVDFFDPEWFNSLSDALKSKVADVYKVSLLPNAKLSFHAVSALDEKMGDRAFIDKHWHVNTGLYDLTHEIRGDEDEDDNDDDEQDIDCEGSIDLENTSDEDDDEDSEEDGSAEFFDDDEEGPVDLHGDSAMMEDDASNSRQVALGLEWKDDWV